MNTSNNPKPADVPVFTCIVYVLRNADGVVQTRVANLPDIQATGSSEREALGKVVSTFKERVGEWVRTRTSIPWIEPPSSAEGGEQTRLIPVHL